MILNAIVWNVDPEIIKVWIFSIRWYGLLWAAAFFFGYLVAQKFFKKENVSEELLDSLLYYLFFGTLIGARLGHVFFYDPMYYLSNPFEILKVWEGGLASHGAAIGMLVSLRLWSKKNKKEFLWTMDRLVIAVALGAFFIRMGNLMNSEIYGVETTMPWGFIFIRNAEILPKHPTQIYEALSYLSIFCLLFYFYFKNILIEHKGKIFGLFLIMLFSARFFIEYIKNTQSDFENSLWLDMGQILSLPFIIAGFILLFYPFKKSKSN